MKISEIPDNWSPYTLYPSSIPHVLHWDLAYLWILRQDPLYRPMAWNARIENWRRLLFLFAAGRLSVTTEEIPLPLSGFTNRYGIDSIQRLSLTTGGESVTVGVVSPIVLVRPLPDFHGTLDEYPEDRAQVRGVLSLVMNRLKDLVALEGADRRLQVDLLRVLGDQQLKIPGTEEYPHGLRSIPFKCLRSIHFHQGSGVAAVDPFDIQIADKTVPPDRKFVPRCQDCKAVLTQDTDAPPVPVRGDSFVLTCQAGHRNQIPLRNLFIWRRSKGNQLAEYVAWRDRSGAFITPKPDPMWPPDAEPDDGDERTVRFTWNPGALGGETKRTKLKLTFEDGALRMETLTNELFYQNLVVPLGDTTGFKGLPVRWEWRDAFIGCERTDCKANQIEFHGLSIAGLPFQFRKSYSINLRPLADVAVGVYPPPMHDAWQKYRAAVLGPGAGEYRLRADGVQIQRTAVETNRWPEWVAVESLDGHAGASFSLKASTPPPGDVEVGSIRMGVDFGTTNTVIYFRAQGETALNTDANSVITSKLRELMYWLHNTPPPAFSLGWFLPQPAENAGDPCLFPSALWTPKDGQPVLRWGEPPPSSGTAYGFKWDDRLQDRHPDRMRYLREVFFWTLPYVLHKLGNPKAKASFDIGFSYPLAFDYGQRGKQIRLINEICHDLAGRTGHAVNTFSVNESLAAVRALGAANPDTHYLVADMGGRTLDVALFRTPDAATAGLESHIQQIGSLDFGGELFLSKVSEKRTGSASGDQFERAYWELRGNIQQGIAAKVHQGDKNMEAVLDRLHTLAFEFLRTMLAAARKAIPEQPPVPIRLLLIGNGWRLRDIRAAGQDPARYFKEFSSSFTNKMGDKAVEAHSSEVPGVRSSKHLVAIGALKAAEDLQLKELEASQPYPAKLPAGRGITVQNEKHPWHELVGQGGVEIATSAMAHKLPVDFDFDDRPVPSDSWQKQLDVIGISSWYPKEDELREWTKKVLDHDRLLKGPLQLVLENHWSRNL